MPTQAMLSRMTPTDSTEPIPEDDSTVPSKDSSILIPIIGASIGGVCCILFVLFLVCKARNSQRKDTTDQKEMANLDVAFESMRDNIYGTVVVEKNEYTDGNLGAFKPK